MPSRKQVPENKPKTPPKEESKKPNIDNHLDESPTSSRSPPISSERSFITQPPISPNDLLNLQRTVGNIVTTRMLERRRKSLQSGGNINAQDQQLEPNQEPPRDIHALESLKHKQSGETHHCETKPVTGDGLVQRQKKEETPWWLKHKKQPKRKVDSGAKLAKVVSKNGSNFPWLHTWAYAGIYPGKVEAGKDGKLYYDPNHEKDGGETSAPRLPDASSVKSKETGKQLEISVGFKFYNIFTRVGPHSSEQKLISTLRHEYEHIIHAHVERRHRKAIMARNKALEKVITSSYSPSERKKAEKKITSPSAMDIEASSKLKKSFGADVSKVANTEVLAYSAAFGDMFKTIPEASARQLVNLVIVKLLGLAFSYDQASPEAKRLTIKQVVDPIKRYTDFYSFMKKVWPELLKAKKSTSKTTKFLDHLAKDPTFARNLKRWNKRKKRRRRGKRRRR